jgi:hypothetical protein
MKFNDELLIHKDIRSKTNRKIHEAKSVLNSESLTESDIPKKANRINISAHFTSDLRL